MDHKEFALDLARRAGVIMKEYFHSGIEKEWKANNTPVTEADKKINQLVIDAVKKKFPDHGVIAEEGSHVKKSIYQWVCDPIDGTIPFSTAIPTCAFSLALVEDGMPILGVIYDPFMNRLFSAEKGKGAYMNDKKISVSQVTTLERGCVGLNGYKDFKMGDKTLNALELVKEIIREKTKIMSLWSIVYPGMLIATGDIPAVIGRGGNTWDYAALKILVEEAGGKVTDLQGNEQRYDQPVLGCLLTNGHLHDHILSLIQKSTQ